MFSFSFSLWPDDTIINMIDMIIIIAKIENIAIFIIFFFD